MLGTDSPYKLLFSEPNLSFTSTQCRYLEEFVTPEGYVAMRNKITSPVKRWSFRPEVKPPEAQLPPGTRMVDDLWDAKD